MKRYKVEYYKGNRSQPSLISQISKSGKYDGTRILFYENEIKYCQAKSKNDLWNGIFKSWWHKSSKIWFYKNWKKEKWQGIEITFYKEVLPKTKHKESK